MHINIFKPIPRLQYVTDKCCVQPKKFKTQKILIEYFKTCWQTHLTYETTETEKRDHSESPTSRLGACKVSTGRTGKVCHRRTVSLWLWVFVSLCDWEDVWLWVCVSLFDCYCVRSCDCLLQFQNQRFLPFSRLTQIVAKISVFCSCEHSTARPRQQH